MEEQPVILMREGELAGQQWVITGDEVSNRPGR